MLGNWTEDRVAVLKKLWLEGKSAPYIAKQLGAGVTRNAVIGKLHRLGLSARETPSRPSATKAPATKPRRSPPMAKASAPRTISVKKKEPPVDTVHVPDPLPVYRELKGEAMLADLGSHMCKWPIGDPSSSEFSFCGRKTNATYCIEHARVAYQPKSKSTREYGAYDRYL